MKHNSLPAPTVCVSPWTTVDRTLYVDLKAYLASVRYNRNVLSTRVATKSENNVAHDKTFILPALPDKPAAQYKFSLEAGNKMTIVSCNRPVHLVVTRPTGVIDMGMQTLFVSTDTLTELAFENTNNEADVEINVISV